MPHPVRPSVKVAVAVQTKERPPSDPDSKLPRDVPRRLAARTDDAAVNSPEMMPRANRDPVVAGIASAARAEHDVGVVELLARGAGRDGAPPAVAWEDRVAMARL